MIHERKRGIQRSRQTSSHSYRVHTQILHIYIHLLYIETFTSNRFTSKKYIFLISNNAEKQNSYLFHILNIRSSLKSLFFLVSVKNMICGDAYPINLFLRATIFFFLHIYKSCRLMRFYNKYWVRFYKMVILRMCIAAVFAVVFPIN